MKIAASIWVWVLFLVLGTPGSSRADFSGARQLVETTVLSDGSHPFILWGLPSLHVSGQTSLSTWNQREIVAPWPSCWVFFIDDAPTANWTHPCRYVFVSPDLSDVKVVQAIRPLTVSGLGAADTPNGMELLIPFLPPAAQPTVLPKAARPILPIHYGVAAPNDHALILSGGQSLNGNTDRYWRDCAFLYDTLVHKYGYAKENVLVLTADGTNPAVDHMNLNCTTSTEFYASTPLDFDGDGECDIDDEATATAVSNAFITLQSRLTAQDRLFVFVTDHGGPTEGGGEWDVELRLWNSERLRDRDLKEWADGLPCPVFFAMEQCYSGGFADDLDQPNRVFVSAAAHNALSYAMPYPYYFDQWSLNFTAALRGFFPSNHVPWVDGEACDADYNADGYVSFREAALFADSHNTVGDSPQFLENPAYLGSYSFLGRVPSGIPPSNALDRIEMSGIRSPATENQPVPFRIEARNSFGHLLDSFSGAVQFEADTEDFVDPGLYFGTGTNEWSQYPFNYLWCQVRVQTIYPAAQLGGPRTLDHLEIHTLLYPTETENWTIRLRHTPLDAYPEGATWDNEGWSVVCQTNVTVGLKDGWERFEFTAPFEYNGVDNLMVDLSFNNPTNYSRWGNTLSGSTGSICTLIGEADYGEFGSPLSWTATNSPAIARSNEFVVLRCGPPAYPAVVAVTPPVATGFVGGVWSGDLSFQGTSKRLCLRAAVDSNVYWSAVSPYFAVRDYPFAMTPLQFAPDGALTLQWTSGTGQTYAVMAATNLLSPFEPIVTHLLATPPLNVYTAGQASTVSTYFRVEEE